MHNLEVYFQVLGPNEDGLALVEINFVSIHITFVRSDAAHLTIESFRLSETVETNQYASIKQKLSDSRLELLLLASDNEFDNVLFGIVLHWTHHSRGPTIDAWII